MTTGIKLRNLREKKKISQEQLAHIVGVSQVTIGNWEQGKSIKHDYIKKLADALDVPIDYLLEEKKISIVHNHGEKDNSINGFEITFKAPNQLFDDLHKKIDSLIDKLDKNNK